MKAFPPTRARMDALAPGVQPGSTPAALEELLVPESLRLPSGGWRAIAVCLMLSFAAVPVFAQTPAPFDSLGAPAGEQVVGRVQVTGNTWVDSTRILRTFEVVPGMRYSSDLVRRGVRKLIALGLFSDVQPFREVAGDTVNLVLRVVERPRIAEITFSGEKQREDSDIRKKLYLRTGDVYTIGAVANQTDTLVHYYQGEGFPRARVTSRADTLAGRNEVRIHFDITEGEKVRITRIVWKGVNAVPEKKLRKAMKTKTKGLFGGGDFTDETFPEDRQKIEEVYRSRGYRDAQVTDARLLPGDTPRKLTLQITVEEGPFYRMGDVTWSGNHVVPGGVLDRLWGRKPARSYDRSRIERTQGLAYAEYAERGYLYVNIDPRETVRDSTVDLNFVVTEGDPSHVRRITVLGNTGTREKVIRRELDLHEGDLFRRSGLVRTTGNLQRLGLFEEVTPDFSAAESTDVDIVLKVKEKQVGTASAGAGYTAESGVTGFIDLGHNNLLGNGQSLQLHLERGPNRSDYSITFTEPWFRDTPTLLGVSAYNTTTLRDLTVGSGDSYDERRRGGSIRLGRPLPWPDYSRGSIAYSLESVEVRNLTLNIPIDSQTGEASPTAVQQELLALQNKPRTTSTVSGTFLRNSTNDAYYPTQGTRLTLSEEFAGGPFGGQVNFIKHRWEGRLYLPSVNKRLTTMLKWRIGLLGTYTVDRWRGAIPAYETFRLGGGNTIDPLRGYQDYQVVPSKFVNRVTLVSYLQQTANGGYVVRVGVPTQQTQRYPGGRYTQTFTMEQQFPIVVPLRGVLFFDAGNVWDQRREVKPFDLKVGSGFGLRMQVPLLGNIGFDYGYGFNRDDGARWQSHFLLGNVNF